MTVPQLYSLGAAVLDSAFYADCPLSKNALAQVLNTSRPTIWRHENIAYWKVTDFKEDYPPLPRELWLEKKCSRDRTVTLSPYQSWVVSLVKECYAHLRKKSAVESFIQQNQYLFTRSSYQNQLTVILGAAIFIGWLGGYWDLFEIYLNFDLSKILTIAITLIAIPLIVASLYLGVRNGKTK